MKRTPLKKTSAKRAIQLRQYRGIRSRFLQDNPTCQVCSRRKSLDIHHKAGRNGERLNDETQFMAVCRTCHDEIHKHPAAARENGWLI